MFHDLANNLRIIWQNSFGVGRNHIPHKVNLMLQALFIFTCNEVGNSFNETITLASPEVV